MAQNVKVRQRSAVFVQLTYVYQNVRTGAMLGTRIIGDIAADSDEWITSNNLYRRIPSIPVIADFFQQFRLSDVTGFSQEGQINRSTGSYDPIRTDLIPPEDIEVTVHKATLFVTADVIPEEENVEREPAAKTTDVKPGSVLLAGDSGIRQLGIENL